MAIDIRQAPAWVQFAGEEIKSAARKGLHSAAIKIVQNIITQVVPNEPRPPVDMRAYEAGWRALPIAEGAVIFNTAPHAPIIEYGARAENIKVGTKMIDALTAWVKRKGIGAVTSGKKRGGGGISEDRARQIAWAIAMSMKKHGIFNRGKGLRILEKAMKQADRLILQEIEAEIAKVKNKQM